jgi:hypothetical protein
MGGLGASILSLRAGWLMCWAFGWTFSWFDDGGGGGGTGSWKSWISLFQSKEPV